jgi:hypothetical protein
MLVQYDKWVHVLNIALSSHLGWMLSVQLLVNSLGGPPATPVESPVNPPSQLPVTDCCLSPAPAVDRPLLWLAAPVNQSLRSRLFVVDRPPPLGSTAPHVRERAGEPRGLTKGGRGFSPTFPTTTKLSLCFTTHGPRVSLSAIVSCSDFSVKSPRVLLSPFALAPFAFLGVDSRFSPFVALTKASGGLSGDKDFEWEKIDRPEVLGVSGRPELLGVSGRVARLGVSGREWRGLIVVAASLVLRS